MLGPVTRSAFAELVIRRTQIAIEDTIDPRSIRIDCHAQLDDFSDRIAMRLVAYVAANTIHREIERVESVPATWWDAFKMHWFPSSWLRRWPAKQREIECEVKFVHMCPHLPMLGGHDEVHAVFLQPPKELERLRRRR